MCKTRLASSVAKCKGGGYVLVDPIHIVLRLNRDARRPRHHAPVREPLVALEWRGAVEPVARVEHDARLVGAQLGLDAREGARELHDDGVGRGLALDGEVAVVPLARAVGAAVAREPRLVLGVAQGQAGLAGEVVDAARRGFQDLAGGEGALVGFEVVGRVYMENKCELWPLSLLGRLDEGILHGMWRVCSQILSVAGFLNASRLKYVWCVNMRAVRGISLRPPDSSTLALSITYG